jgi:iron complex outermembrane recepter protein
MVLLCAAQPAYAQTPAAVTADNSAVQSTAPATLGSDAPPPSITQTAADAPAVKDGQNEIVVTGSLIARPDYKADSPIVSVSKEAITNTGQVTVESALTQLPQFTGGFGQSNTSSTGTGLNGGQSYATLRGLGSKRTLLLLDGKRLQPSNPDGSVDLNIIPDALIANVEVITGGASTAYGSDATAGVVNFRLKHDLKGLTVSSQIGTTNYGDGNTYRFTATGGGRFSDDRGRAVISLDYSQRNRAKRSERPWYSNRLPQTGNAASANGSASFTGNEPTLAAVNAIFVGKYGTVPLVTNNGSKTFSGGAQIGFNTDGTLFTANGVPALNFRVPQTDDAYLVDSGNTIYGPSQQLKFGFTGGDLQTDMKRYSAFGRVDYDLTDDISVYSQFMYTTYKERAIVNTTLSNNIYLQNIPYNNPFLPADFSAILASRANPTADFQFAKAYNAIGNRFQGYQYNVWQFMLGATGKIGIKDWTWEIYADKSSSDFTNTQSGGLSLSRVNKLVYDPTGGTELCDGGLNLFGNFPISASCAKYIERDTLNTTHLSQKIASGTMQGELFKLPAGELRFAVGADYRSNSFSYQPDGALDQPDGTSDIIGFAALRHSSGEDATKEFFAELLVPILKDLPLVKEFNVNLGYRYSDYDSIGGASTYKADFDWSVNRAIRLRGGYNRAIRAPSVGELFAPVSSGSISIGNPGKGLVTGDPCDVRSSFRLGPDAAKVRQLCLAQGIAPSVVDGFIGTAQVFPLTGGNPSLTEETADTYSLGAVLSSPFDQPLLRNAQFSIDWYNIKISNAIGVLSIVQSVQYCFNVNNSNPTYDPNNYYCKLIGRDPSGAVGPQSQQPLQNLGAFKVSGIDFQFDWRGNLEDMGLPSNAGSLSFRTVVSYLNTFKIQLLPGAPTFNYAGTIGASVETNAGITHPKWKANTMLTYSRDSFSLGITWRFIDKMKYYTVVTSPTTSPPGVAAYHLFDLNARYTLPWGIDAHAGISNVFNRRPPSYSSTPETYDASTYDVVGRSFFLSLSKSF